MNEYTRKLADALGLAKRAGAVTAGTELVIEDMRKGKAQRVYISSEVSPSTLKKLKDKAEYYKVRTEILEISMDELAHCVGLLRPTAAVSLTDKNFLKLTEKINRIENHGGAFNAVNAETEVKRHSEEF